jgi:hypothetical protein
VTEQTKPTNAEAFADALGPMFEIWGYAEGRECLRADLVEAGPEEMADQFRKTAELLEGLGNHAEDFIGFGSSRIIVDARWIAERAREVAERHAEGGRTCTS